MNKPTPYPFRITAGAYLGMTSIEVNKLHDEVHKMFKKKLEAKWVAGIKQVVICDGEVAFETDDEETIISDVVDDIAKRHNRACYTFSAPDLIDSG